VFDGFINILEKNELRAKNVILETRTQAKNGIIQAHIGR